MNQSSWVSPTARRVRPFRKLAVWFALVPRPIERIDEIVVLALPDTAT